MEQMLMQKKKTLKKNEMADSVAAADDLFPDLSIGSLATGSQSAATDASGAAASVKFDTAATSPIAKPKMINNNNASHLQQYRSNRQIGDNKVTMSRTSKEAWITQQEKAFTGWANAHLQTRSMYLSSLQQDIPTVAPLIHLLEILEKKPLKEITKYHKKPRHKFDLLDGMRICLKQIRSRGRKDIKIGFDAEILLRGQEKKQYLALIWRIIVNYAIEDTTAEEILDNKKRTFNSPEARMRWWCNSRLPQSLQIKNFTSNWSSGKVLVSLMNQALDEHDRITEEDMEDMDTEELLEGLLKLGDKHLHIPQLLDPNDLMFNPNKEAVMTYVSLLRTAIESKDQERSAAEAGMKKMKDAFANLEDNWLNRVKALEGRLEDSQRQVSEYAERLQEERHTNSKQLHAAKEKTDGLYHEIEQLKALCLDQQHQKEMMAQDAMANDQQYKQEVARLKTQILQLQARNDQLNEQLNEVNDSQTSSDAQNTAFGVQLQNVKANAAQNEDNLQNKIAELEALNESQRQKFNEFYEQFKKKLETSNKAGREYREKCIVITTDTETLRKRIAELEALLQQKEKELEMAGGREHELLDQLATQETVFRIQLQELGQFIKEMKQREQLREKQQVEAYHKLLREREARIAKDKERKRNSARLGSPVGQGQTGGGGNGYDNVDVEAQRAAMMDFERRKSQQDLGSHGAQRAQSPSSSKSAASMQAKPAFDKRTEAVKTKFGNEKVVTTWNYTGKDKKIHEVILRHNTSQSKDGKSKRVIVVDGNVRYAEKSKETHFIIKNGKDQLKLNIAEQKKGFAYQLFINDISFTQLHNSYINQLAGE